MKINLEPSVIASIEKMQADNERVAGKLKKDALREKARATSTLKKAQQAYDLTVSSKDICYTRHFKRYLAQYKADYLRRYGPELLLALHQKGFTRTQIAKQLEVPKALTEHLLRLALAQASDNAAKIKQPMDIFNLISGQIAHVSYKNEGRSGEVILEWGSGKCRFWYEFGGKGTIAFVNIPTAAHWQAQTGIPLAERERVLQFLGARICRDQAPGHPWEIQENAIVIYE